MKSCFLICLLPFFVLSCTHTPPPKPSFKASGQMVRSRSIQAYDEVSLTTQADAKGTLGTCTLPGILTIPKSQPGGLVVILHGSGALDRNGAIGSLTTYKDLAHGLAGAGFASVRYDKRSLIKDCADRFREEGAPGVFVEDGVQVTQNALNHKRLKGLPVFILGHSQGVNFAIEISVNKRLPVAGVILMAGLGRYPIDATFLRQLRAQISLPGVDDNTKKALGNLIAEGEAYFMKVREGTAGASDRFSGAYSKFWREWIAMTDRAATEAMRLKVPSLVLQGDKDQQVLEEDFVALKEATKSEEKSQAHWLKDTNHFFTTGQSKRVDPVVINLIADWLNEVTNGTGA
jgi:hypothetical protein